jgi:ankyrin repeat protein
VQIYHWNGSPLIRASSQGHINVVKCLLSSGVEINLRDKFGQSPLYVRESTIYIYIYK